MSNSQDATSIVAVVQSWKHRKNQRYKVLRYLESHKNAWIKSDALREDYPEIKAPGTVLYDMALRNPSDTARGLGYYERMRVYPKGYTAKPLLKFQENLGYRIRPEYLQMISQNL